MASFNGYNFFHNSPFASRGVGILVKQSLNLVEVSRKTDRIGNILALSFRSGSDAEPDPGPVHGNDDQLLTLISLYGPNDNNGEFYADLNNILRDLNPENVLIGGDWNATWDSSPPEENLDVLHMRNIPSRERTERVRAIANRYGLIEPLRFRYPTQKDYSYIPNAAANINRSRIDYFLIHNTHADKISETGIKCNRLSTMFDHKCIFLNLGNSKKSTDRNKINDTILDNDAIKIILETTVKENYLNNADPMAVPRYMINTLKAEIGRVHHKLKIASDLELAAINDVNLDNDIADTVIRLVQESREIAETLPGLEFFEALPVSCSPDLFFEGLIYSVKNEILSKQAAIYKIKKFKKKSLRDRIWELKKNFAENFREIFRQEKILDNIVEEELRAELKKYKNFERLNNEKITPHFMNLVKNDSKNNVSLDKICKEDGTEFLTGKERNEFISTFYKTLYEKNENVRVNGDSIRNFLGDVVNHPAVADSKLNDDEKSDLDSDLTLGEFDEAVLEAKNNGSPGIDGISNKFIKRYWQLFRVPLFRYTEYCLENGNLTENFKCAKIRLIPKKGDPKKISNWRPISLLNCFYKIISRVLANRMKKVSDKILHVGQKGYSKKKWCQEVAISLIDNVCDLRAQNKSGCIVSLDIKKAFDSISHDFMEEALRFFNFGDRYIGWIKTICTKRRACIILNTGTLGASFDLERGNAQGDVISPFVFNICYQILLLKIELDLQIEKVDLPQALIADRQLVGAVNTVSHRAKKVFAFADDCNILAALNLGTVSKILKVINDFGEISGLLCNLQKSSILPIGNNIAVPVEITELGFEISEKITVLGFHIDNSNNTITCNTEKILEKIQKQKAIWTRYNLSLPGRINVCKTMFYSQLNYIGSVLPVSDTLIDTIEDVIYRYVCGNMRLAKERTFLPVKMGGLGLFKVKKFLDAQACSWIRRSRVVDQDWKARLLSAGSGNIYRPNVTEIQGNNNPVSNNIIRAYMEFIKSYTETDNNYRAAYILNNLALTIGLRSKNCLTMRDLEPVIDANGVIPEFITNLKVSDLFEGNRKITKPAFNRKYNVNISEDVWQKLDKIRNACIARFGSDEYKPINSLENFFARWKKGSKPIRNILCRVKNEFIPHNIVKFADCTETVIGLENAKYINSVWNRNYFGNDLRVFIFKLHNNVLPYNTVLSHFVRGVDRNCTFCDIVLNPVEEDENALHLFFNCSVSERLRNDFITWISDGNVANITRRDFFTGFRQHNQFLNEFLNISLMFFKKFLWDARCRKCLPQLTGLKHFIKDEFSVMKRISSKFNQILNGCGVNLLNILENENF
jgi:exonuclease III